MIVLTNVTKRVTLPDGEDLEIVRDATMTVHDHEVTAIMGRSGSGKSTLLNLMGLLDTPSAGTVSWSGLDTTSLPDRELARIRGSQVGFVFQQYNLLDHRSALRNVMAPLFHEPGLRARQMRERARQMLAQVGLGHRVDATPSVLSGGEQQRVAIARALIRSPRVVLADEPTGALDPGTAETVLQTLLDVVRAAGVSLVLVTHDDKVAGYAQRTILIDEGRLREASDAV